MKELNDGKQMKDVWTGSLTPQKEKEFGKHPTQKPLYVIERLLRASTQPGDVVLDPFMGSGTTGVACKKLDLHFIGIEKESDYAELAKTRIINMLIQEELF